MKHILFIFLAVISLQVQAQAQIKYKISGKVVGLVPPNKISVNLVNHLTNKLVKVELVDVKNFFLFEGIPAGQYIIQIASITFNAYRSSIIELKNDIKLPDIALTEKENTLNEVTIQAFTPAIQHQFGKVILNVGSSISGAGSTAMEILEKAPGVLVDQNDNISLRGKQGIMVMIDGKRVPISGTELASLLRSTSSDNVDRIELITNPSAKYDAQGNAGIIDIQLKKDVRMGTNGTVTGSFGQGEYSKVASGFSFNTREKNFNLFGSYNYNHRKDFIAIEFFRRFLDQDMVTSLFRQNNLMFNTFGVHNYRIGADYNVSKSTILGLIYNGLTSEVGKVTDNKSLAYTGQDVFSSSFLTNSDNVVTRDVHSINLNLKHNFDNKGKELTADVDYARFNMDDNQNYITRYFNQDNSPGKPNYNLKGALKGLLGVKSLKADYAYPLKGNAKLEFGIKSSLVKSDNDVQFFDDSFGANIIDTSKSNHFLYDEYIHAAYVSGNKTWKKLDFQLGLRLEQTVANGLQLKDNTSFNRSYAQLFPNVYAGYKLTSKHQIGLALSRRINRSTYNQLNPFKIFLDTTTYVTGNPYLKPELTNAENFLTSLTTSISLRLLSVIRAIISLPFYRQILTLKM